MLLSVLRAAGAREAAPAMIALLDRPSGRERWTVMRELIALDAALAWPHLQRMAAHDPEEGVRDAARSVLTRHGTERAAA
jgi:HEAT repeat protein